MLRDLTLELVNAPGSGVTITLPGSAPTGRLTWASTFISSQPVFYVLDDSTLQEWGVGVLTIGAPSTITRPTVVLGNSSGTTARLNFPDTCRCYCTLPASAMVAALTDNAGRNLIHNPLFNISQRGVGPWTAVGYTMDRWKIDFVNGSCSVSITALSDANRTSIGDETATNALTNAFVGSAGATDYQSIRQPIENVRRLAGKTVTVSFWAAAASGTPNLGVNFLQNFGTGGSPSGGVHTTGQSVVLSTTWTRYYLTFAVGSASGKTLGSNGNDFTSLNFWFSGGTSIAPVSGSVGVQTATISIWGVQAEIGPCMSPLDRPSVQQDTENCKRYAQLVSLWLQSPSIGTMGAYIAFPETMRAAPSTTNITAGTLSNATIASEASNDGRGVTFQITATVAAGFVNSRVNLYSADL